MSRFPKVYHRKQALNCPKLVIAVHGMGDQHRNDMVRMVARQLARVHSQRAGVDNQALRLPQGLWEGENAANPALDDLISFAPAEAHDVRLKPLADMAFAEIYWADLPREIEQDGRRLEPLPQWAGSVVDRLRQREDLKQSYTGADVSLGATVVEEVAETVKILERVLLPLEKAGSFQFDLGRIVDQYLGDVQQVADFTFVRENFLKRFLARIGHLANQSAAQEIHFVAHSEGSVLTLRALLRALNLNPAEHNLSPGSVVQPPAWLSRVRSLTTLGSPIDKHLILWPEMWGWLSEGEKEVVDEKDPVKREEELTKRRGQWHALAEKIRWRNYYDLADPVGYDLDTAREKLSLWGCEAFDFLCQEALQKLPRRAKEVHDHGFRRYPLAGMAHLGYFNDTELFAHIYDNAICKGADPKLPDHAPMRWISPSLPFVIVAVVHVVAIVLLHQSLSADKMTEMLSLLKTGSALEVSGAVAWLQSWSGMLTCGLVLLGSTVWSRVGVIAGFRSAQGKDALFFHLGMLALLVIAVLLGAPKALVPLLFGVAVPSVLLVGVSALLKRKARQQNKSPLWALRIQMICGGVLAGLAALCHVKSPHASLLTAVLGVMTFLYVWWLGVLLFDLCYVWKRYINTTGKTFLQNLREHARWHA